MYVNKLFIPVKESWKFLATWGLLWIQAFALRIQWDLSSWKQAAIMIALAIGTIPAFISIWVAHRKNANNRAGLYLLEALRAKVKTPWMLLLIPFSLLLGAYLVRNNYMIYSFFIGGALSFCFSLFIGKLIRR
jgi:hypothetical protein